ncbi:uncharacterized protein KY384_000032 [Bacidia gigantensis]|uniref:uncharacterized protein n=1 Tax=Bacidia gigantensis TaxID=2732470 RepID=UPI001D045350|nr:uncharacterized protein KY384_000032 [Bacidia gigantensis]KAG8526439.1 hypothetical protein KY384_000032 [Bacidia gigantensis]
MAERATTSSPAEEHTDLDTQPQAYGAKDPESEVPDTQPGNPSAPATTTTTITTLRLLPPPTPTLLTLRAKSSEYPITIAPAILTRAKTENRFPKKV